MPRLDTLGTGFSWAASDLDWPVHSDVGPGLAGVVAATTRVVWVDPSSGHLAYRGVPIEILTVETSFESVAHLLITGRRSEADDPSMKGFERRLRESRALPDDVVALLRDMDPRTHPTRLLRAGVSALGCHELSARDDLAGERHWRELRILGQVAGLVSEVVALRRGVERRTPSPDAGLARQVLADLAGSEPDEEALSTLDLLWTVYAAHGLDAPTFTSMIVASCHADPYYNVVAGLSALRGHLQGGAGERVLQQLLPLSSPTEAETWVERTLTEGGRIAGFGHRVYRMPDPRVVILRKATASLCRHLGREDLFVVARTVEDAATRRLASRGVHVNLNFYGALLFHLLGADPPLVPCLYAIARTAGLVAFVHEAMDTNRLYRPLSRYIGPGERHLATWHDR